MADEALQSELAHARRELERLQAVLASTSDPIIGVSSDGIIWEWNRAAEELFGYCKQEMLGCSVFEKIQLAAKGKDAEPIRNLLGGTEGGQLDAVALTRDLQTVPLWVGISPVPDFVGQRRGFSIVARDLTGRLQVEERLKQSLQDKEALLKEVHHRVKNNLQVICSMLRLQANYADPGPARTMFKSSEERVQAMGLVHERLYRSKNSSAIDIGGYVVDLAKQLSRAYDGDGGKAEIDCDLAAVLLPIDRAVPFGLLASELLTNALKHGRSADGIRRISLKLSTEKSRTCFSIADQGGGLPQGIDTVHPKTLGLRLVHALCQQLHGQLSYTSDNGARFIVEFPSSEVWLEPEVVYETDQHSHL
jgi:PAS domain S-box-containing protein